MSTAPAAASRSSSSDPSSSAPSSSQLKISYAQAQQAFAAAEAASAATKAVMSTVSTAKLSAKLTTATEHSDRVAAAHMINERFAACASYEEAIALVADLLRGSRGLCAALVEMLVNGDALGEIAVQLLLSLSLNNDGAENVVLAGAVPVLTAVLRADEPLMRAHGLALLATLAERPALIATLVKAGVVKLICFLGMGSVADPGSAVQLWPSLLDIADLLLRDPRNVPDRQRQQLRDVLVAAARSHKAGSLPLALTDVRTLNRLMIGLRALNLVAPPAKAKR